MEPVDSEDDSEQSESDSEQSEDENKSKGKAGSGKQAGDEKGSVEENAQKDQDDDDEGEGEGDIEDFPDSDFVDIFIKDIELDSQAFDIDFHPFRPIISIAQLTGEVALWNFSSKGNSKLKALTHHSESVRAVAFSPNGKMLFTGSVDCSMGLVDVETMQASKMSCNLPVNVVKVYDENTVVSGHDEGEVQIWDARQAQTHKLSLSWGEAEHGDYVTDMCPVPGKPHLLVTSGDGTLSVYDMRKRQIPFMSEVMHDDMTSVIVQKNGKKNQVVCGTREGVLNIFNYGNFGVPADRDTGHPSSVDCLVSMNEQMFCSGSSDGLIRVLQLRPAKDTSRCLGVIGHHEGMPVERLKLCKPLREPAVSEDGIHILGSISHDNHVKFWDVEYLFEEDEEADDDDDGEEAVIADEEDDAGEDEGDEGEELESSDKQDEQKSSCSASSSGEGDNSSSSSVTSSNSSGDDMSSTSSGSSLSSSSSSSSNSSSSIISKKGTKSNSSKGSSSGAADTKKRKKQPSSEEQPAKGNKKSFAETTGIEIQRKSKALFKQSTSGFFDGL